MEINRIGIIGIGSMGGGISQTCAEAGFNVLVYDISNEIIEQSMKNIDRMLKIAVRLKRVAAEEKDTVLARISTTTVLEDMKNSDLIVEAAPEVASLKKELFKKLDTVCPANTIFSTNTSSLSVTDLASSTNRPDKFLGLHFFNPATETSVVEVVRALKTSSEAFDAAFEFVKKIHKTPIEAKDTPGFIVNRLMVTFLNEGARMVEEGLASAEDIDRAWRLSTGMPKGPMELMDLIGIDVATMVGESMYREFRAQRYHCPPILRQLVRAGYLGKKSGRGFYNYSK